MFTNLYMIYNQLDYLFQQLLIADGLRRSYNDSGSIIYLAAWLLMVLVPVVACKQNGWPTIKTMSLFILK